MDITGNPVFHSSAICENSTNEADSSIPSPTPAPPVCRPGSSYPGEGSTCTYTASCEAGQFEDDNATCLSCPAGKFHPHEITDCTTFSSHPAPLLDVALVSPSTCAALRPPLRGPEALRGAKTPENPENNFFSRCLCSKRVF